MAVKTDSTTDSDFMIYSNGITHKLTLILKYRYLRPFLLIYATSLI